MNDTNGTSGRNFPPANRPPRKLTESEYDAVAGVFGNLLEEADITLDK